MNGLQEIASSSSEISQGTNQISDQLLALKQIAQNNSEKDKGIDEKWSLAGESIAKTKDFLDAFAETQFLIRDEGKKLKETSRTLTLVSEDLKNEISLLNNSLTGLILPD